MTTQHDYARAINNFNYADSENLRIDDLGDKTKRAILHALEVCKSLQNGPSEGMEKAGWKTNGEPTETFNAMIKQLYKEI